MSTSRKADAMPSTSNVRELTRRTFVKRTSLLLSSVGISTAVQSGLMDSIMKKATRKWGPEALGQSSNTVHFMLEICIRAGFQINALFPSFGHGETNRNIRMNYYSSTKNTTTGHKNTTTTNNGGRPLYYSRFRRSTVSVPDGAEALFTGPTDFSPYIATSEAIPLNGGHTADWKLRRPMGSSPCPAVLHNAYAPPAAVRGLSFGQGAIGNGVDGIVYNMPGDLTAGNLTSRVPNRTGFLKVFDSTPIYFSQDELKLIIGSISQGAVLDNRRGALGDLDNMFLARGVQGADGLQAVTLAGRGQSQLNFSSALAINGLSSALNNNATSANATDTTPTGDAAIVSNFGGLDEMQRMLQGNEALGLTLASIYKAWRAAALSTAVVSLNSDDWHDYYGQNSGTTATSPVLDNAMGHQGLWNIWLGNALNGLLRSMAVTPDPYSPGSMMLDSFLIVISSEFTRTVDRTNTAIPTGLNNNDGGTQGVILIGSKVKGGTYGDITPDSLGIQGFNPTTGATMTSSTGRATEGSVYKAIGRLAGIDGSVVDQYAPGADPIATCLIR